MLAARLRARPAVPAQRRALGHQPIAVLVGHCNRRLQVAAHVVIGEGEAAGGGRAHAVRDQRVDAGRREAAEVGLREGWRLRGR